MAEELEWWDEMLQLPSSRAVVRLVTDELLRVGWIRRSTASSSLYHSLKEHRVIDGHRSSRDAYPHLQGSWWEWCLRWWDMWQHADEGEREGVLLRSRQATLQTWWPIPASPWISEWWASLVDWADLGQYRMDLSTLVVTPPWRFPDVDAQTHLLVPDSLQFEVSANVLDLIPSLAPRILQQWPSTDGQWNWTPHTTRRTPLVGSFNLVTWRPQYAPVEVSLGLMVPWVLSPLGQMMASVRWIQCLTDMATGTPQVFEQVPEVWRTWVRSRHIVFFDTEWEKAIWTQPGWLMDLT